MRVADYVETRSKQLKGISTDEQLLNALIRVGVQYDITREKEDEDEEGNCEIYRHIDSLMRLVKSDASNISNIQSSQRRGRPSATTTIPDIVKVTVCELVVSRGAKDVDTDEGLDDYANKDANIESKKSGDPVLVC